MRFKDFFLLRESAGYGTSAGKRTVPLSYEDFIQLYKKNCTLYKPESMMIYRGNRLLAEADYAFADPNVSAPRPSRNTQSFTMWLMENMEEWQKYPLRSKSLICSTTVNYASGYGKTFNVIPYDSAKIGVCPTMDFFESIENKLEVGVDSYNHWISNFIDKSVRLADTHGDNQKISAPNFGTGSYDYSSNYSPTSEHFFSLLKSLDRFYLRHPELIDELVKRDSDSYYYSKNHITDMIVAGLSKKIPLVDILSEHLTPDENGFQLFDMHNFNTELIERTRKGTYGGNEVWTNGPALFVEKSKFNDLVAEGTI
jgi:hypothetical protein